MSDQGSDTGILGHYNRQTGAFKNTLKKCKKSQNEVKNKINFQSLYTSIFAEFLR